MKLEYYRALMDNLDAAVDNGYSVEVMEMTPEQILDDMIDSCGDKWLAPNYDREEYCKAIQRWKDKQMLG